MKKMIMLLLLMPINVLAKPNKPVNTKTCAMIEDEIRQKHAEYLANVIHAFNAAPASLATLEDESVYVVIPSTCHIIRPAPMRCFIDPDMRLACKRECVCKE